VLSPFSNFTKYASKSDISKRIDFFLVGNESTKYQVQGTKIIQKQISAPNANAYLVLGTLPAGGRQARAETQETRPKA